MTIVKTKETLWRVWLIAVVLLGLPTWAVVQASEGFATNRVIEVEKLNGGADSEKAEADYTLLEELRQQITINRGQEKKQTDLESAGSKVNTIASSSKKPEAKDYAYLAQQGKAFTAQYPAHQKIPLVWQITALAALEAAKESTSQDKLAAIREAEAVRRDPRLGMKQRFAVALSAERLRASVPSGAAAAKKPLASGFVIPDKLRKEFGQSVAIDMLYIQALQSEDAEVAKQKATALLQEKNLAPRLRDEAKNAIARHAMIGQKVNIQVRRVDGTLAILNRLSAQPTVVVFTTPKERFEYTKLDESVRWVHVLLDPAAAINPKRKHSSDAIIEAIDPLGYAGPLCRRLQAQMGREVYVFDGSGKLVGFGSLAQLGALVGTVKNNQ